MPIRIDYNAAGDLGRLAVQAGEGAQFHRQFQAEQSLVQNLRQHQIQKDALAFERVRESQRQALQNSLVSSGVGSGAARRSGGPMARTVKGATPSAQQPFDFSKYPNLNIDAQSQEQLSLAMQMNDKEAVREILSRGLRGGGPTPPGGTGEIIAGDEAFRADDQGITGQRTYTDPSGQEVTEDIPTERRGGFVSGALPTQGVQLDPQKLAYIDSLNLGPGERATAISLARGVDLGELATKLGQTETRQGVSERSQRDAKLRVIEDVVSDVDNQIKTLDKTAQTVTTKGSTLDELRRLPPSEMTPQDRRILMEYYALKRKQDALRREQRDLAFSAAEPTMLQGPGSDIPTSAPVENTHSRTNAFIDALKGINISK